jgi:WD40 repeat protein
VYDTVADYSSQTFDIRAAAVSGSRVAAVGRFKEQAVVGVWDKAAQAPTRTLRVPALDRKTPDGSQRALTAVAFVPGQLLLVARHATGPLAIWSTTSWKLLATVDLGAGSGLAVHGQQALALEDSGKGGRRIVLVDLTTRTTRTANAPGAEHLAWSHDGSRIAVLGQDNTVRYRDADLKETGEPLVLPEATDTPTALALSPDGDHIAIAVGDEVLVHETVTGLRALPTLHSSSSPGITGLSWSPDGEFLAAVTQPVGENDVAGPVSLWRVDSINWRQQICQWTGRTGLSTEEWRTHIGDRHAYIDLCAETK